MGGEVRPLGHGQDRARPMRLPLVEGTAALREKFRRLIAEYDLR